MNKQVIQFKSEGRYSGNTPLTTWILCQSTLLIDLSETLCVKKEISLKVLLCSFHTLFMDENDNVSFYYLIMSVMCSLLLLSNVTYLTSVMNSYDTIFVS